jgi:tripartite-type tricarboxylate transporter receptor subunit TctC
MTRKKFFSLLATAALVLPALASAQDAEPFPSKPVQIIIPAAAGNSPDVAARLVADKLTQLWKQQVVIINRPGAGGLIAAQAASQADKSGYTLYMTQASTYTVLPITQEKLPFDLFRDFTPIGLVAVQPIAVAVAPSLGIKTLADLIALIRATQGGMLFAASNRGGQSHLTGELFKMRTGLDLTFVHASGAASSVNDVSTGRIPIMFEGIAGIGGAIKGGMLTPLAIATEKRLNNYPDIPTVSETVPGFVSKGWLALMAPAGTPDNIIAKVNADLRVALAQPDLIEKFEAIGTYPQPLSPTDTLDFMRAEQQLWWPVVRQVEARR